MDLIAERDRERALPSEPLVPNASVLFIDDVLHVAERVVTTLSAEVRADSLAVGTDDLNPLIRAVASRGPSKSRSRPLLALVTINPPEIDRESLEAIERLIEEFNQDDDLGILFVSLGRIIPDADFAARFDLVLSLRPHARFGSLDQRR
jgi:hypothetical protein